MAHFGPGPRDRELASRLGIAADEVVVGYISSFQPYEDFDTLVEAIAILRSRGRPVRGLLVGGGRTWRLVERRVASLGLGEAIALPGPVPHLEVPRYYRLIDVFVVPRTDRRVTRLVTPLKTMEAMATGRPVVVSRLPALLEPIVEGETGLSFEAGSASQLAEVLDCLVTDAGERRRMGDAGRAWVLAERTLERNAERYRALYEGLGIVPPAVA